jgi:hypothetical protein
MSLSKYDRLAKIAALGGICFFITFVFWQGTITVFKVRQGLFDYDYLPKPDMFMSFDEPPLIKFYIVLVLATFLILFMLNVGFGLLAAMLAGAVHHLRGS